MKKKIAALLLAGLLVVGLLSGCSKGPKVTDTVRWMNGTYAGIIMANQGDYNQIGGYKKSKLNELGIQQSLEASWGVTDRATAEQAVADLLAEGHRASYAADMQMLAEEGWFELSREEIEGIVNETDDEEYVNWLLTMIDAYLEKGEHATDAWDYCRVIQLLGSYYIAGYYTAEEALDQSLEVSKQLQTQYASWDEMLQSYMWGYQYWSEDNGLEGSETATRWEQIEQVKAAKDSPYLLDWKMTLEKSW